MYFIYLFFYYCVVFIANHSKPIKCQRLSKKKVEKILGGTFPKTQQAQDNNTTPKNNNILSSSKSKLLLESKYDQGQGKEDLTEFTDHQRIKEFLNDFAKINHAT